MSAAEPLKTTGWPKPLASPQEQGVERLDKIIDRLDRIENKIDRGQSSM